MAPSASDIITYGGVPLAVIGVLPTLYIFFRALMTLRDTRRTFARNHVVAVTRPSTLAGLVEVELPRLSLAPLDRNDPLYFKVNPARSELKGGSWTAVHWREMRVGTACYRVQYHDQLRQPAADVDFESLVAFMLDRGAVPDACGWADLREAGMWTPTGTVLLRSPAGGHERLGEPVLRTTTSEDSDGLLALILNWRSEWDSRTIADLPPYWMRIKAPLKESTRGILDHDLEYSLPEEHARELKQDVEDDYDGKTATESSKDEKTLVTSEHVPLIETEDKPLNRLPQPLLAAEKLAQDCAHRHSISSFRSHGSYHSRHASREHLTSLPDSTTSLRLRLAPSGLSTLLTEPVQTPLYAPHILPPHALAPFFSAACSALAHLPSTNDAGGLLWSHTPPAAVLSLSHTPSIPIGILSLLDILPGESWRSPDHLAKLATAHEMAQLNERQRRETQMRAMMSEGQISDPAKRQRATVERMQREMTERRYEQERARVEQARAEELEVQEAVSSRRVGVRTVAETCREWLVKQGRVDIDQRVSETVEMLLWECVRSSKVADAIGEMLSCWETWLDAGGISREGFEWLKTKKIEFCYAACLLGLIGETATSESGSVGSDMQECLRLWKKVRLG